MYNKVTSIQKKNSNVVSIISIISSVTGLFLSTQALFPLLYKTSKSNIYNSMEQYLWILIYIIVFFLLTINSRRFLQLALKSKFLIVIVVLMFISCLWSDVPFITFKSSLLFAFTTLFALHLSEKYTWSQFSCILAIVLGCITILSYIFVFFVPSMGIESSIYDEGAWKGIFHHKNILGRTMFLSVIVFLFLPKKINFLLRSTFILLSLLALIFSTSATSIVLALWTFIFYLIVSVLRKLETNLAISFLFFFFGFSIIVIVFFISNLNYVMNLIGKDLTLTGRTELWIYVAHMINEKFLLGYGYKAFWLGWEGPSAFVWRHLSWYPMFSHNGYLEIGLQLGIIGVAIVSLRLISSLYRTLLLIVKTRKKKSSLLLFSLVYLQFLILYNLSESTILEYNSIHWIIFVFILIKIKDIKKDIRGAS